MGWVRTPRVAVGAMFLLAGSLFGTWASRIPAFVEHFRLSEDRLGLLLLCIALGAIIAFPFAGRLSDRIGANQASRRMAGLYIVALGAVACAPTVWSLGAFLVLFGAALGGLDVAMNAWGAEVEQRHGRPIMSSFHAMFSLGTGLGAATGYVAVWMGKGVVSHFLLNGAVFGAAALSLALVPWSSRVSRGRRGKAFALPSGALVLVGLAAFCASVGEGAIADWSAVFLYTVTEVSEAQAALGYAVFSIAMVIMRLAGDWAIQRLGPVTSARLSGLTAALGVVIVVLGPTLPLVLVGFAIMGFGYAVVAPLTFSRAAMEPGPSPGQAIASVATLNYGGMLVGPPLIGFVAKASSLPTAFVLLGALSIAITALGASLREPKAPGNL